MPSPSLSNGVELPFFSLWSFQPRSSRQEWSDEAAKAYRLMSAIKNNQLFGNTLAIPGSVQYLKKNTNWIEIFGTDRIAIPVPKSAPRHKDSLWVPLEIANALRDEGLVADVSECLERVKRVNRSSTAGRGNRPSPIDHFNTIQFDLMNNFGDSGVILVDDVITRGSTIVGCTALILDAVPGVDMKAFTMLRTMGLGNFHAVKDSCEGAIQGSQYSCDRTP